MSEQGFAGIPEEALEFYEGLEADNSKAYWADHKAEYESAVRAPMETLLALLAPEFGAGKIFRPYRDVRFARDKSPYKTQIAAVVEQDAGPSLYLQLSTAGLLAAGGMYATSSDQVERFRTAAAADRSGAALERVVASLRARGYGVEGSRLKTRPRGVPPEHPRLDLLRHRSLIGVQSWPPAEWLHTPEVVDRVREAWRGLAELNGWLARHVGPPRA